MTEVDVEREDEREWTIYVCPGCGNWSRYTAFGAIVEHTGPMNNECAGPSETVEVVPKDRLSASEARVAELTTALRTASLDLNQAAMHCSADNRDYFDAAATHALRTALNSTGDNKEGA